MYAKGGQGVGAMSPLTPPPSASDTPSTAASDDSPCSHTAAARRSGSPYPCRKRLPSRRGPAGHGDFGRSPPEPPPATRALPQAGPRRRPAEPALEVLIRSRDEAPVIPKRLLIGLEDAAVVVRARRPHFEAFRDRMIRDHLER